MVSLHEEEDEQPDYKIKGRQGAESTHLSGPQKVHATSEFVIVAYNGGRVLLHLASTLTTVVR